MVARLGGGYGCAVSHITVVVDVDAPRELVWEVVADPRNLPKWDRHVASVSDVPDEGLKVGTVYATEIVVLLVRSRVDAFVKDLRPPEYAEIVLTGAPLRAIVRTTLTALSQDRTRLEQDVEYHVRGGSLGEVLGRALRRLGAQAILRRGVEGQKRQAEELARKVGGW